MTALWLLALTGALLLVEGYTHRLSPDGFRFLLPDQRLDTVRPLIMLYGGYLSGILGFWYFKPFKPAPSSHRERGRFVLAVICTCIFNIVVLYLVSEYYFLDSRRGYIEDQVVTATKIAGLLSFLVAPINLYYFGMKAPAAPETGA